MVSGEQSLDLLLAVARQLVIACVSGFVTYVEELQLFEAPCDEQCSPVDDAVAT